MQSKKTHAAKGRFITGIILIVFGILFFLENNFNYNFDFAYYFFSWKTIVLIIGLVIITNNKNIFRGYFLVILALTFWSADYYDISVGHLLREYWPVLLILFGLIILLKKDHAPHKLHKPLQKQETNTNDNTDDYLNISTFAGHKNIVNRSQNFSGGKITTIISSNEIIFNSAKLSPGSNFLEIFNLAGSTEIFVPQNWNVKLEAQAIFGATEDKRISIVDEDKCEGTLIIKGLVLFGALELGNYK